MPYYVKEYPGQNSIFVDAEQKHKSKIYNITVYLAI